MFQASHTSTKMVGTSLSEDKTTKNMNDRQKASSGLSLQGSDYISTRKLSIVGRSYAVQSPILNHRIKFKKINLMFQASHKMVGTSLSEDKTTKNMNDRRKASSGLSLQGSDYISTRKLSIVGRSYAVQSPIVPSIALSATTSLDQPHEDPPFTQGKHKK